MAYTTINKSGDYFNTKLYSGTGSAQDITGLDFQPDFNWIKRRNTTGSHRIQDAVRGSTKYLASNATDGEVDAGDVDAFLSNGFSLDSGSTAYNASGSTYASWNWKANGAGSSNTDGSITSNVSANTTAGFSIATYTGNGTSGATFGHGLNSAPEMVIIKQRNSTGQWRVGHVGADSTFDQVLNLNLTNAKASASSIFNSTAPSSTVVTLGNEGDANGNNNTFVAYNFHSVKGYSKFGSYTGNGSTDGTFVYTGFKPAFVMVKRSSGTDNWMITDNKRSSSGGNNVIDRRILPNLSNAEFTNTSPMDLLSNGFKHRDGDDINNASGSTYIYMAFAAAPLVGTNNIPANAR